jgi:murein DD-endopeptidase MepM/ murein hydrolase activator NlpD
LRLHGLIVLAAVCAATYPALLAGEHQPRVGVSVAGERRVFAALESAVLGGAAPSAPSFFDLVPQQADPALPDLTTIQVAGPSLPGAGPLLAPSATPAPVPSPTPAPSRRDLCQRSAASGLYCVYTVQAGDTLSAIALEFGLRGTDGVSAAEMLAQSNKPDVVNSDAIIVGQMLRIPLSSGIIHTVFAAETLDQVASDYGVSAAAIRALGLNNIGDPSLLLVGQEIIVPGPSRLPAPGSPSTSSQSPTPEPTAEPTATPTPEPTASPTPEAKATAAVSPTPRPPATRAPTRTPTPVASVAASRAGFIWPATGPISSYFGPRHPLGIDIDFFANPNQPVKAAAAGTVSFAGGDPCCSYGYYVIIEHGNGFSTLYAHLARIDVVKGQRVAQGQVVGLGGRTGYATGNHLHFEVRKDGAVVDPLGYLP